MIQAKGRAAHPTLVGLLMTLWTKLALAAISLTAFVVLALGALAVAAAVDPVAGY